MKRLWIAAALAAVALTPALGQDATRQKIEDAVEKVLLPKLKQGQHTAVSLGVITCAETGKPAVAGAGLAQLLAKCLTKHGIGLTPTAAVTVTGTLARILDAKTQAPATKLVLRIDVAKKPECEIQLLILMEATFTFDPTTVSIPPKATPLERIEIIRKAREVPPPPRPGTTIWTPDGTVGLEMLLAKTDDLMNARTEGQTEEKVSKLFAARDLDKKGRVKTADGESCRFRITNKNPFAVAGSFRVAGLDWSEFSILDDDKDRQPILLVVPANSSVVVRGWIRTESSSLTFDVKNLPASAAGSQGETGVVQFEFAASWKEGEQPAPGDEAVKAQLAEQQIRPGTEQGDRFEVVKRIVSPRLRGAVKLEYGEFKE